MKFVKFSVIGSTPFTRMLSGGLLLAAFGMTTYAHIMVAQAGDDYRGFLAPLDRLFDLFIVAILGAVTFFVGRATGRKLNLHFANSAEEVSLSVMIGTGILGLALFGLGLVGLLKPSPIFWLMILLTGWSRHEATALHRLASDGLRLARSNREHLLVTLVFGAAVAVLILRAAVPPYGSDEVIYHLPATKNFVEHGQIYPDYNNPFANLPFLIHMIYAICIMVKADIAARLFSLFLALMTALALYGFCARFLTCRTGLIALFAFFGSGMVIEVAVTTRIDVTLAGMLFLATHAMMVYLETREKGWLYASAMLSGFSLGVKLTAALWIALVGLLYLVESASSRREALSEILKRGLVFTAITIILVSPWFIKNLVWFQNPIYPFVTGEASGHDTNGVRYFTIADEKKLDAYLEVTRQEIPAIVATQERILAEAVNERPERHPFRFWEYFTKPDNYNVGEPNHYPNYLFLVAPLFLLLPMQNKWVRWLAFFSAAFFLGAVSFAWIGRYLLPLYPPLTLVTAYTFAVIPNRIWPRAPLLAGILTGFLIALSVVMTFVLMILSIAQMYVMQNMGFIRGELSRHEFMFKAAGRGYYPAIDFVNRNLPGNARIMLFGAQLSYGIKRDHLVDPLWDATEWRRLLVRNPSFAEVHQDLKHQGITHILFYPRTFLGVVAVGREGSGGADAMYPSRLREGHADSYVQLRNWATFELYKDKFLTSIYSDENGYIIYKLK